MTDIATGPREAIFRYFRPDEVVRTGRDPKVVGDVWCGEVVHLVVEENPGPGGGFWIVVI